ncbi:hypothetical protein ACFYY8_26970 [Streptosporangium sp. NPDC001559]|uniref:hypothetical protein n=1 Tax=Streptosporangium sp. NPDC001559 TaxID=3366187 RepID=UPI0036E415D5
MALVLAALPMSPAAAAVDPAPTEAYPTIAPPSERGATTSGSDVTVRAGCAFVTNGDYVHKTGNDATGHGWWINVNCGSGTRATVKIWLEEYFSDGSWRVKGSGSKSPVYSGGGSANRANARATCNNSTSTSWRSRIDVDLIGQVDSPEQAITAVRDIACHVN